VLGKVVDVDSIVGEFAKFAVKVADV